MFGAVRSCLSGVRDGAAVYSGEYLCAHVLLGVSYLDAGGRLGWAPYLQFCLLPEAWAFKGLFLPGVVVPS